MPSMGSTSERGYGGPHRRTRAAWAKIVDKGGATCWRCEKPIKPGSEWVLGHQDYSGKMLYRGVEHKSCSDRSGQQVRQAADPDPRPPRTRW
jgi:hypothetical protein